MHAQPRLVFAWAQTPCGPGGVGHNAGAGMQDVCQIGPVRVSVLRAPVAQVGVDTMLEVSMRDIRTKSVQLTSLFLRLIAQVGPWMQTMVPRHVGLTITPEPCFRSALLHSQPCKRSSLGWAC